jgi:hypothetical protein
MQHTLEMGHNENKGIGQEESNGKLSSQADIKHSLTNCELQYVVWERRGPDQGKRSSCGRVTVHCIGTLTLGYRCRIHPSIDIGLPLFPAVALRETHRIHME